jgi:hypothetical protein
MHRLDADGARHTAAQRLRGQVLQQRRLAHAPFAMQHQRLALTSANSLNQAVEHPAFGAAVGQLRLAPPHRQVPGHVHGTHGIRLASALAMVASHWRMPPRPHGRRLRMSTAPRPSSCRAHLRGEAHMGLSWHPSTPPVARELLGSGRAAARLWGRAISWPRPSPAARPPAAPPARPCARPRSA